MRLPNNAYDALRAHTQKLLDEGTPASAVFQTQLILLSNIPIFKDEVTRLRDEGSKRELSEYARSRLLRLPAVGLKIQAQGESATASSSAASQPQQSTPSNPVIPASAAGRVYPIQNGTNPSSSSTSHSQTSPSPSISPPLPSTEANEKQKAQRLEYIRTQREREQKTRNERDRIRAQIKADREERRRLDEMRKHGQQAQTSDGNESSSTGYAKSDSRATTAHVRVQVRTFDGSTLRDTFPSTSSITEKVRPWIDGATNNTTSL